MILYRDEAEATELRTGRYAVRPIGQLGTCGYYPFAWSVIYVNARSAEEALRKVLPARTRIQCALCGQRVAGPCGCGFLAEGAAHDH